MQRDQIGKEQRDTDTSLVSPCSGRRGEIVRNGSRLSIGTLRECYWHRPGGNRARSSI